VLSVKMRETTGKEAGMASLQQEPNRDIDQLALPCTLSESR
jgi:hypothetical protein